MKITITLKELEEVLHEKGMIPKNYLLVGMRKTTLGMDLFLEKKKNGVEHDYN